MRKPITIAMLVSVGVHIALFLLADWLIADTDDPRAATPLPVITVESLRSGFAEPSERNPDRRKVIKAAGRPENFAHTKKTTSANEKPTSPQHSKRAAAAVNRLPSAGLEHASTRTAEMSASKDAAISSPDVVPSNLPGAPIVMSGSSRVEPPTFSTAEMSRRQEKMFKRKFKEWTENFQRMSEVSDSQSWRYKGQEYSAEFTHEAAGNDMGIEHVTVVVTTEENGQRLSTEVHMKRLSFSSYAQFINRWDHDVHIHDDELDGRFHSNSQINLAYSRKVKPRFFGQVTTSARGINIAESRGYVPRDQIFLGGLQTGVRAIRLPEHILPFATEKDRSDENVHHFDEDTRITFREDGSYLWQPVDSGSSLQTFLADGDTWFLVADKNVELYVKGTVNGKVLVYSPERIVIEGNLVYAEDPKESAHADDFLGLTSDKYVDIAPPDVTGPGDLIINAAIYAKRRFTVKRYRFRDTSLLYIYGSLTAGTLSATEPRYATKIEFDQRLETLRPPRFPMTDRYAIESWDNNWRVEPAEMVY